MAFSTNVQAPRQGESRRIILSPGSLRGFRSAVHASVIGDGQAALLQNIRLEEGTGRVRWADTSLAASIGTGTCRGVYRANLNGTEYLFAAMATGGAVSILRSADNGANWTNITPDGGTAATSYYGDCRLTDSSDRPVRFCVVKERRGVDDGTDRDLLLIQNNSDAPRVYGFGQASASGIERYSSTFAGAFGMAKVTQPDMVAEGPNLVAYTGFANYLQVRSSTETGAVVTTPASNAGIDCDDHAVSSTLNHLDITINHSANGTPYVVGNTVKQPFTTPMNASESKQLVLIGECSQDSDWARKLVIAVADGSSNVATVYSKADGVGSMFQIQTGDNAANGRMAVYSLPSGESSVDWSDIDSITFGYSEVPDDGADVVIGIYMIAAGGHHPGGSDFGVTYSSADSRQEGPGQIITRKEEGILSYGGGPDTGPLAVDTTLRIVEDQRVNYDYVVSVPNPSEAQRDAGIDFANLYIRETGTFGYYYLRSLRVCRWDSGSTDWVFVSGGAGDGNAFDTGNDVQNVKNTALPFPDEATICLPVGAAMTTANGRLFVGAGSRLYFSEYDKPFLFRKAVRAFDGAPDGFDPASGSSSGYDGQTIQALVPIGSVAGVAEVDAPLAGGATIFMLTDSNLYSLSGFDARSLSRAIPEAPYGTVSPFSVQVVDGGFYYLNQRNQVIRAGRGGISMLSKLKVDDLLRKIPTARRVWVAAEALNDRYYLAYSPVGATTNTRCLVWSEVLQEWESQDTFASGTAEFLMAVYANDYVKLLRFSANAVHEYEQPDLADDVTFTITFPEIGFSPHNSVIPNEMEVVADLTAGAVSLSGTFIFPEQASGTDATFTITRSGDTARRGWMIGGLTYHPQSLSYHSVTYQPKLSGTVKGGTRIYSAVVVEQGPGKNGASVGS